MKARTRTTYNVELDPELWPGRRFKNKSYGEMCDIVKAEAIHFSKSGFISYGHVYALTDNGEIASETYAYGHDVKRLAAGRLLWLARYCYKTGYRGHFSVWIDDGGKPSKEPEYQIKKGEVCRLSSDYVMRQYKYDTGRMFDLSKFVLKKKVLIKQYKDGESYGYEYYRNPSCTDEDWQRYTRMIERANVVLPIGYGADPDSLHTCIMVPRIMFFTC